MVSAPDVERAQRIDHGAYALLVFAVPLLGGALLEAGMSLLAERHPRPRVAAAGLMGLALALAGCALANTSAGLALGLAWAGAASGVACAVAQAELVASAPEGAERAMLRWALFGELGDALTPPLTALVLMAGGSYRGVFVLAAAVAAGHAGLLLGAARRRVPARSDGTVAAVASDGGASDAPTAALAPPPPPEPLLVGLRAGLRNGPLWLWLLAASLCTFLDELVIALAALHADRDLGASPAASVACVSGAALGAALGAVLGERLLAWMTGGRVLVLSALGTLVALAAVVLAPSVLALGAALAVLGACAAPQHALLQARAHASVPGRPGIVNAVAQFFVVVDIAAPLALGALADRAGLPVALAALSVQPLGVLAVLAWARRERPARAP